MRDKFFRAQKPRSFAFYILFARVDEILLSVAFV